MSNLLTLTEKKNLQQSLDGVLGVEQAALLHDYLFTRIPDAFASAPSAPGPSRLALALDVTAQPDFPEPDDTYLCAAPGPYTGDQWGAYGLDAQQDDVLIFANGSWNKRLGVIGETFVVNVDGTDTGVMVGTDGSFKTFALTTPGA